MSAPQTPQLPAKDGRSQCPWCQHQVKVSTATGKRLAHYSQGVGMGIPCPNVEPPVQTPLKSPT